MKRSVSHHLILIAMMAMSAVVVEVFAQSNPCTPGTMTMTKLFTIDDSRNVVTFESKAPLERIIGTTSRITGKVSVNPRNIKLNPKVEFELELATIKTGIPLRDRHMREQYLETDKFPKATLRLNKITKASGIKLVDNKPVLIDAIATLKLHGVSRKIKLRDLKVTYFDEKPGLKKFNVSGDLLQISGDFTIRLSDYGMKVPQFLLLKLSDEHRIDVSLLGTTARPKDSSSKSNPCNPCGGGGKSNPCNPCGGGESNPCNPCGN